MNLDSEFWELAGGKKVKPENMPDEHLKIITDFLEENCEKLYKNKRNELIELCGQAVGEITTKSISSCLFEIQQMTPEEWLEAKEIYQLMQQEMKKRGLKEE